MKDSSLNEMEHEKCCEMSVCKEPIGRMKKADWSMCAS